MKLDVLVSFDDSASTTGSGSYVETGQGKQLTHKLSLRTLLRIRSGKVPGPNLVMGSPRPIEYLATLEFYTLRRPVAPAR